MHSEMCRITSSSMTSRSLGEGEHVKILKPLQIEYVISALRHGFVRVKGQRRRWEVCTWQMPTHISTKPFSTSDFLSAVLWAEFFRLPDHKKLARLHGELSGRVIFLRRDVKMLKI